MSADIIPTNAERGQFRITDQMMYEAGAVSMEAFGVLLRQEAARRSVDLMIEFEMPSRDIIVSWRPGSADRGSNDG